MFQCTFYQGYFIFLEIKFIKGEISKLNTWIIEICGITNLHKT